MNRSTLNKFNQARSTAFLLLLFWMSTIIGGYGLDGVPLKGNAALHTALETCAIIVFSLVFTIGWNAVGQERKKGIAILSITFLCVALLSLFHELSFQGMPDFITKNEPQKAIDFYMLSRLLSALALMAVTLIPFDATINRRQSVNWLITGIAATLCVSYVIIFHPELTPDTFRDGVGMTVYKQVVEYGIGALNALTTLLVYRQLKRENAHPPTATMAEQICLDKINLFIATTAMTFSAVYFASYSSMGNVYNLLGHLFQVIAAVFLYRAVVSTNINAPHQALSHMVDRLKSATAAIDQSRVRMTGIIQTATDAIISTDESQIIVLANPAAAAMFGTTVKNMQGSPLEKYIPQEHLDSGGEFVKYFGKTGISFRMMGRRSSDYAVTGLKASGDEFPLEGSISTLIDNGNQIYTVILRDITERKQAQQKLAESHAELRQLSGALQTIREEERKHIARELHDDLGQLLATLRMDLTLLQQQPDFTPYEEKILLSMDHLLAASIASLRRIATNLRPRALDEGGLYFALQSLRKEFAARHLIECELFAEESELALDDNRSTAIYRIVQESLTNIVRHAKATKVSLKLFRENNKMMITIQDDGRGIVLQDMQKNTSFGLVGMRERVGAMHGEILIAGKPGHGTRIEIVLPISPSLV